DARRRGHSRRRRKGARHGVRRHTALPALSMSGESETVRLRPPRRADWDLIRGWLARPDIEAWWGPRNATEAEVNIALNSGHALCRIIDAGGAGGACVH